MPRETKRPQQPESTAQLPELTHKQQGFVKGILSGLTASDAYRASYDASRMTDEVIWVKASELKSSGTVSVWLRAASQHNLAECKVTLETHTAELDRLSALAEQAGAYGASIKAQELRGRANGLYVDQIKTDDGKIEVLQALRTIAEAQPDLAHSLASLLNVSESDIMGTTEGKPKLTH